MIVLRCLNCFESINDDLEVCPFCGYIEGTPSEESIHMSPGTKLADRYVIGRVLGFGGFGVTYLGWDEKLEQKVAIKEYLPSEFSTRMPGKTSVSVFNGVKSEQFYDGLNKFVDEARRLSKFQNEDGIVKIFDCIAENDTAYIIMEYLEGETLADKIKREGIFPEKEAVDILMPVMKSLETVHREKIIHRDISPDNIFLTKDGAKLIDFGAARFATTSHSRSLTVIIKPGYSAEEQYRSRSDQGPHTDVYSLAATLYKMITGETPPDALERRAKIESTRKDILAAPRKYNNEISLVTANAILNAMNIRIEDRTPTVGEFVKDLTSENPVKRVKGKVKVIEIYRIPLWFKIILPIAVVGLLVLWFSVPSGSPFRTTAEVPDGCVIVPNVEGMDIDSAIRVLQESGLNYIAGGNAVMDYVAPDTIAYQTPETGRVLPVGSSVELVVSKGSGNVVLPANGMSTIPAFLWSEEEDAIDDFTIAGLDPHVTYVYDDNVSEGQIVGVVDIEGNELSVGDMIEVGSWIVLQEATQIRYSEGLSFTCHADGTATLSGLGDCTDVDLVIPPATPDGHIVDEIFFDIYSHGSYESYLNRVSMLETVVLPNCIVRIEDCAFAYCVNLTSVVIPDGVMRIGDAAFSECYRLDSVEIPDSVNYVGTAAFRYCISLSSVTLPDDGIFIGDAAFANCESLVSINGMRPGTWVDVNNERIEIIDTPDTGFWYAELGLGNRHYYQDTPR